MTRPSELDSGADRQGHLQVVLELMNTRKIGSRILVIVGSVAMLVGALDPLEGSLVILPGSGLVTLGTFLSKGGRHSARS